MVVPPRKHREPPVDDETSLGDPAWDACWIEGWEAGFDQGFNSGMAATALLGVVLCALTMLVAWWIWG